MVTTGKKKNTNTASQDLIRQFMLQTNVPIRKHQPVQGQQALNQKAFPTHTHTHTVMHTQSHTHTKWIHSWGGSYPATIVRFWNSKKIWQAFSAHGGHYSVTNRIAQLLYLQLSTPDEDLLLCVLRREFCTQHCNISQVLIDSFCRHLNEMVYHRSRQLTCLRV